MMKIKFFRILSIAALSFWALWFILGKLILSEVVVVRAFRGDLNDSVSGNAKVLASKYFEIRALSNGKVTKAALSPMGKPIAVAVDETLFELEASDLVNAIERLNLNLTQFEQKKEVGSILAQNLAEEMKDLELTLELASKSEGVASHDVNKKKAYIERLKKELRHEELGNMHFLQNYELESKKLNALLSDRKIKSPIQGKLVTSFVSPGSIVFVNDLLGQVYSDECMIELLVKEEDCLDLGEGLTAKVHFFSTGGQTIQATVSSISPLIDADSGLCKVFLKMDQSVKLPIGSSGRGEIIKEELRDVVIIPKKSLMGDRVFVERNGVLFLQKVEVGASNLMYVEVLSGVRENDLVVTSTPHVFRNGQEVRSILANF